MLCNICIIKDLLVKKKFCCLRGVYREVQLTSQRTLNMKFAWIILFTILAMSIPSAKGEGKKRMLFCITPKETLLLTIFFNLCRVSPTFRNREIVLVYLSTSMTAAKSLKTSQRKNLLRSNYFVRNK